MVQDATRSPFVYVNTPSSHLTSTPTNYQQQRSSRFVPIPQWRRNLVTRTCISAMAFKYEDNEPISPVQLASFAPMQFSTLKDNAVAHEFSLAYEQHCQEILEYIKSNQINEASSSAQNNE